MESDFEDFSGSSDGDVEDEFALDELKAGNYTDINTALKQLRQIAANINSSVAGEAALELLRLVPSLESLRLLVDTLIHTDSYQNSSLFDLGWSFFSKDKQPATLIETIKIHLLPNMQPYTRLQLALRCILTITQAKVGDLKDSKDELKSLRADIAGVDKVWKGGMQHKILVVAVQVHAHYMDDSIESIVLLQHSINELEQSTVSGVVLDNDQLRSLNEIKAGLAIESGDIQKAQGILASISKRSKSGQIVLDLISLCLDQAVVYSQDDEVGSKTKSKNNHVTAVDQNKETSIVSELAVAWKAHDSAMVSRILDDIKAELIFDGKRIDRNANCVDICLKNYKEQNLLRVLKFYRRVRYSEIQKLLPSLFTDDNDIENTVSTMKREKLTLMREYMINSVDRTIDRLAFADEDVHEDVHEDVETAIQLPAPYSSLNIQ